MNPRSFHNGKVQLYAGNCVEVLRELPDNSIDAVCTDPPYHLTSIVKRFGGDNAKPTVDGVYNRSTRGFMGKQWDGGDIAFRPELWAEVLRVLKPGGHMVCFGGTRTYHRMACAIEDAGFEVREMLSWVYAQGFPKSHNVGKDLDAAQKRCTCHKNLHDLRDGLDSERPLSGGKGPDMQSDLQGSTNFPEDEWSTIAAQSAADSALFAVRDAQGYAASVDQPEGTEGNLLQPLVPSESSCGSPSPIRCERVGQEACWNRHERTCQSGMEGRGDVSQEARELHLSALRAVSAASDADGEGGWIHNGTSAGDGRMDGPTADANRMRPSSGPRSAQQQSGESGIVAVQPKPQERRAWHYCERCGKPIIPDGLGTALKPAHEPICLARKPLSEGTVAANVLRWGTGALNIDGCRIDGAPRTTHERGNVIGSRDGQNVYGRHRGGLEHPGAVGRWPANLCHDNSPEVLAGFPDLGRAGVAGTAGRHGFGTEYVGHKQGTQLEPSTFGDSGSAARFFYTAKADKDDRLNSNHPTVKPVDLMQWLVRLVCSKGATVLDPFAGTGTTGAASFIEGRRCVLIEREAEYLADIERRMELLLSGSDERARKLAKPEPYESLPLFGVA